jgi:hypothetical protein
MTSAAADRVRPARPHPLWMLWSGILAGPIAWAFDLVVSYALVKWTCSSQRTAVLHLVALLALVTIGVGALIAWRALREVSEANGSGDEGLQRPRFMAILGLASCALFALTVVAGAIPPFVFNACQ